MKTMIWIFLLAITAVSAYSLGSEVHVEVNLQPIMDKIEEVNNRLDKMSPQTVVVTKDLKESVNAGKFEVTAYSPYDDRNGINSQGDPNKTATGTKPRPGTFAVDPKVIPYGSKIVVIYDDGTVEHGVAEDTGGAIKKNRLDVFRHTFKEAMQHGRKEATVVWWEAD